jgi:hypothetical protein
LEKGASNKPLRLKRVIVRDCAVVGEDEWIHYWNATLRAKQHRFFRQQWIYRGSKEYESGDEQEDSFRNHNTHLPLDWTTELGRC